VRVVVFGASGATGRHLVSQALEAGHEVTAFVRDAARLGTRHEKLSIVQGDVADPGAVARGVAGQDAALSALGVGRPLRHDQAVIDGVGHVLKAMERESVRRLVYLSTTGVRDSRSEAGFAVRLMAASLIRNEIADHEIKEGLVRTSALDWTIVRAPMLTHGPRTGVYRAGEDVAARSLLPKLSRADIAEFMIQQLHDARFLRKAPRVMR
jgi:putative NADH-flavin reductase